MTPDILWLDEVRRGDVAVAGGKAANLGELIAQGFPVPPGFVLAAPAYQRFAAGIGLNDLVLRVGSAPPAEIRTLSAEIAEQIRSADVPDDLRQAIVSAWHMLRERCGPDLVCAVRSSGTAEDLGTASFAGQHGTYYYVDEPRLLPMIRNCWASLWNEAAARYRATHGMDHGAAHMAVVVQRQIPAEISGVTFTANPVTGARNEIVTEASWGMGAAIVDGRVTPDRYVVSRDGFRLMEEKVSRKRFRVSTTLRGGPEGRLLDVPLEQQHSGTLSPQLVLAVARLAVSAEERFGAPQDVEWAIADGTVNVLQSRPITVAGQRPFCRNERGGTYVLFKPLVENFTDPLTPLTANMWLQGPLTMPLAIIGGRVYFDVEKLRRVFPFRITDAEVAQLLYLSAAGVRPHLRVSLPRLPVVVLLAAAVYVMYANVYVRSAHLPADFMDGFRGFADSVDRDPRYGMREALRELFLGTSLVRTMSAPLAHQVLLVNSSAMRYFVWFWLLKRLLHRWLPDLPADALGLLTTGSEGVLSAETGRHIWRLALVARQNPVVRQLLADHAPEAAFPKLRSAPEATGFLAELDRFLATFGHRALKEFEFRSPRWEEDPVPVLGMIRNFLLADLDPDEHERRVAARRAEMDRVIALELGRRPLERALRLRTRLVRYVADRVKYLARLRENSRFYWVMGAYVVRRKILRLEQRLISEGRLRCRDDIFFLDVAEVEQLSAGLLGWTDVEERIAERRREHVRLSKVTPPRMIGIEPPAPGETPDAGDGAVLRGQAASAGRHEGRARVILDPQRDVALEPGEVLVAPYTDPAWTPLFLTAGAAVVEVGSFLSHAGTVAREYGMPCVVDVADCTTRIRTGDRLIVDGNAGLVRVLP
jgi:phosphohistidine swiveling domain-containing protein